MEGQRLLPRHVSACAGDYAKLRGTAQVCTFYLFYCLPTTTQCCREPGSSGGGGRPGRGRLPLDRRTRNAVAAVLRQSELLDSTEVDDAAEEREEEQRRQLRGLLS